MIFMYLKHFSIHWTAVLCFSNAWFPSIIWSRRTYFSSTKYFSVVHLWNFFFLEILCIVTLTKALRPSVVLHVFLGVLSLKEKLCSELSLEPGANTDTATFCWDENCDGLALDSGGEISSTNRGFIPRRPGQAPNWRGPWLVCRPHPVLIQLLLRIFSERSLLFSQNPSCLTCVAGV